MSTYHEPSPFRYNLNAFLQALRSVTFRLQSDLAGHADFHDWYSNQQESMRQDPLLRRFVDGRNTVVKERNLMMNSRAAVGVFDGNSSN